MFVAWVGPALDFGVDDDAALWSVSLLDRCDFRFAHGCSLLARCEICNGQNHGIAASCKLI